MNDMIIIKKILYKIFYFLSKKYIIHISELSRNFVIYLLHKRFYFYN